MTDIPAVDYILECLEAFAVPMDEREFSRKRREIAGKIKKADGIVYMKDNGGSLTNGE
jgi:hypothetical protein